MSTEIRVSGAALGRGCLVRASIGTMLILTGAFGLVTAAASERSTMLVFVATGVLTTVVAVAGVVSQVSADADGVEIRRLVGLRRRVPAGRLERAVLLTGYEQYAAPLGPKLVLLGVDGRRLLNLAGHTFRAEEMQRLLRASPCDQVLFDVLMTPGMLDERVPGAVPWWERHPFWMAFGVVAGIIVLVVLSHAVTRF